MYSSFPIEQLAFLRCPQDGGRLEAAQAEGRIADGRVRCRGCAAAFPIKEGILSLLDPARLHDECAHERALRDRHSHLEYAHAIGHPVDNAMEMPPTLASLCPDGAMVLELGCGTGRYTTRLVERCRALVAMDFSLGSLALLAGLLPPDAAVGLVHADIGDFKAAPGVFDACLSTLVSNLPTAGHRTAMFRTVAHGLKAEGRFVFGVHFYNWRDRSGKVRQADRYSDGGIFRYRFQRREIVAEARRDFGRVSARPIKIYLPLAGRLGLPAAPISRCCERLPLLNGFGELLLVEAKRPITGDHGVAH